MNRKPTVRLSITEPFTDEERDQLCGAIWPLLPETMPIVTRGSVIDAIEVATTRARPGIDYAKVAALNRPVTRSVVRAIKHQRPPQKDWPARYRNLIPELSANPAARATAHARAKRAWKPLQTMPRGGGRPRNIVNDILMKDLLDIYDKHGIGRGWKKGSQTRLSKTYAVCAGIAGLDAPSDAFGIWKNAIDLEIE